MEDFNYAGSQWAKWDLHIHSNASDGKGTPAQIIQKAKEKGLSVIALTDHHTVRDIDEIIPRQLKKMIKPLKVQYFQGLSLYLYF